MVAVEHPGLLDIRALELSMATAWATVQPQVGTPETGLWCDTCNLSSVLRYPLMAILSNGVQDLGTVDVCLEHSTAAEAYRAWRDTWPWPA